jgi:hypothetical protein
MKPPSLQFYPGDWLRDDVAGCSLAAQGLWLRMMFIAHDSEPYGHLSKNGSAMKPESIARRCGCSLAEYEALLAELTAAGVPSFTTEGVLFSRRMARDAELRADTKARVQKHRRSVTPLKRKGNADLHSSSSSSSSIASIANKLSKDSHTHSPPKSVCVSQSKFSIDQNKAYAWAVWEHDQGIDKPDAWAAKNLKTGEYDHFIEEYLANPQGFFPAKAVRL